MSSSNTKTTSATSKEVKSLRCYDRDVNPFTVWSDQFPCKLPLSRDDRNILNMINSCCETCTHLNYLASDEEDYAGAEDRHSANEDRADDKGLPCLHQSEKLGLPN